MAKRFNPPPNWKTPNDPNWIPPKDWKPDPSWGPAPEGWDLWVDDESDRDVLGATGDRVRDVGSDAGDKLKGAGAGAAAAAGGVAAGGAAAAKGLGDRAKGFGDDAKASVSGPAGRVKAPVAGSTEVQKSGGGLKWLWLLLGLLLLALLAWLLFSFCGKPKPPAVPDVPKVPSVNAPSVPGVPGDEKGDKGQGGDVANAITQPGTFKVGEAVAPGTYRSNGDTCTWKVGDKDGSGKHEIVTLKEGQEFTTDCASGWNKLDDTHPEKPFTHFGDGTHEVGKDVEAGTYTQDSDQPKTCTWAVLKGVDSDSEKISGGDKQPRTIEIGKDAKAVKVNDCGTFTKK